MLGRTRKYCAEGLAPFEGACAAVAPEGAGGMAMVRPDFLHQVELRVRQAGALNDLALGVVPLKAAWGIRCKAEHYPAVQQAVGSVEHII